MFQSTRKSRRHQNPLIKEENKQPFFSKKGEDNNPTPGNAPFFQTKLAIGQPGDKYEQEADAMANQVVNGQNKTPVVQRHKISAVQRAGLAQSQVDEESATAQAGMDKEPLVQEQPEIQREAALEEEEPVQMQEMEEDEVQMQEEEEEPVQMMEEEEEPLQTKEAPEEEEEVQMQEEEPLQTKEAPEEEEEVQMKAETRRRKASPYLSSNLKNSSGKGKPLPRKARSEMENAFGTDFSGVNIHTDSDAMKMNKELGAQAFTHGKDVYFNAGKYHPENSSGKHLLAHELTHVVQQVGGGKKVPQVQGIFGKAWKKVKKAAKWVGGKVASGAKAVGKGAKWLGGKIAKGAKAAWKGIKWVGKKLKEKTLGILHRVKRFITSFPARVKRLAVHLWEGVKSLKPWSLSWWKSLGKASTWKEFGYWIGEFAIYALETLGIGEVYETIVDLIKFNTRPLTSAEIAIAKTVFGNSIDYSLVRVDERAILGPSWTKRAYVSFHTINDWGAVSPTLLIHELTHVWQYQQMGAMYMPRAIHAQKTGGYNYGGISALEANKHKGMAGFNLEQQGEILADYYKIRNGMAPDWGTGTNADLPLYEIYVNEVKKS